jgi:glycosyltransferase involved in cell wall biosynthesis
MRIGIDAHIIGKQKGGVETFVENAIHTLARMDRSNDYFIYLTQRCRWQQTEWPENFHLRRLPTENPWLERLLVLPNLYRSDRLDVIYVQRALPLWGCSRSVVHIFDALYVTHAKFFSPLRRAILNPIFRRSGRRATRIVTSSSASRDDIVHGYGVKPEKIVIVPAGVDMNFFHAVQDEELRASTSRRFQITSPYVIFLGALERTKNVHGLLEAYAKFRVRHPEFQLIVAGSWRAETAKGYKAEIENQVRRLSLEPCVRFTGYLSREDYRVILSGARMLVFPSFGEGFGLPPLEAMACGVPVITSNLPVLRELYKDCALMADPFDTQQLADAMIRLANEEDLAHEMIKKGRATAMRFSWEAACSRLLEVFDEAASSTA